MKINLKKTSLFASLVLSGALATASANPTYLTTGQGQGSDVAVRGGSFAASGFGGLDILRVRNAASLGDARKVYLRFDLKTLPEPAKNATAVTLGLRLAPAEGHSPEGKVWTFNVAALKDASEGENWDEKVVSWENAPANDAASPLGLAADVLPLGTFTITGKGTAGEPIAFSSPQLLQLLKRDTNGVVTLVITRQEQGNGADDDVTHIFASKENAKPAPPLLSVGFHGENATLPDAAQWATLPVGTRWLPYETDILAFEAADRKNPPAKGGIVFVGSSSIRLWKTLAQDFPNQSVLNRGFGGSEISDSVHFAQRIVTPYEPKMIVMYAGTNDVGNGKSAETIFADYKAFVAQVRAKLPTTPIAYISISPSPARWSKIETLRKANALIEDFSKTQPNLKFIDIYPLMLDAQGQPRPELFVADGLHMNPTGYAIWVKAVAPYLPAP